MVGLGAVISASVGPEYTTSVACRPRAHRLTSRGCQGPRPSRPEALKRPLEHDESTNGRFQNKLICHP